MQVSTINAETTVHPDGRIVTERVGHVLKVGLDRPAKRNAITAKMMAELSQAYSLLEGDDELRCCVVHAIGDHFSSGVDSGGLSGGKAPDRTWKGIDPFDLQPPYRRKPVIVALKGYSYTVSLSLALAADITIAADNSRLGMFEVKHGLMPSLGGVQGMITRAGLGNAMRYLLTGEEFDAATALRLNLVQEVVAAGNELERALELAHLIAAMPPLAVQAIRRNGRTYVTEGWSPAIDEIAVLRPRLFGSEDAREASAAIREKRAACFAGR